MSTDRIWGSWNEVRVFTSRFGQLWNLLAAQNVGTPEQRNNFGLSQRRCEIEMLWSLFCDARPSVILEVGVAQGGTLAGWIHLASWDCTVIAIDRDLNDTRPRPGDPTPFYSGPLKMYEEGGGIRSLIAPHQRFFGINGWTHDDLTKAKLNQALDGRKIDWCFHDASHFHEDAYKDFCWLWPILRSS